MKGLVIMAQKNDEKILELKKQIENKRQALNKQEFSYSPITNCLLVLDKVTYNLRVENLELMLIKVNMMVMAAKDAGLNPSEFIISGFSLNDWLEDIKGLLSVQRYKKENNKLNELEKQLTNLLTEDKKVELEIENLAALLN